MVLNKNFVLSVFSIFSLFAAVLYQCISSSILCVFTFGICSFRHVGFHVRILVMRITVEVVPGPQDIRCRAFTSTDSHMEANMAEIADAKCEHAQYVNIQEETHLIDIEQQ